MLLSLYRLLSILLLPILKLVLYYRLWTKKEDPNRFQEKFAITSLERNKGTLIWFHVASIGEMRAIVPILEKFSQNQVILLITSGTLTSAKIFETLNIKNAIHQFAPLDSPMLIKKFLKHWRPNLLVLAESEIWPNMIIETSKYCKLALINARMSDRSFKRWNLVSNTANFIFSNFSYIVSCSAKDYQRFKQFSDKVEQEELNLKYCAAPLSYDEHQLNELQTIFINKKLLLCASTHSNEEEQILSIYPQIKKIFPDFSLIIVPRHPNRGTEILSLAQNFSRVVSLRSKYRIPKDPPDIYVADTIGELGLFYRLCHVVFVGGSLIKHGGQNVLEPARLKCCILSGSHYHNFTEIVENFKANQAITIVKDAKDLASKIIELFEHPKKRKIFAENAYNIVSKNFDLVDKIFHNLTELIRNDKVN